MSSESRIAQFKAALGKKVPGEEAKPPSCGSSVPQQAKSKTPAKRGGRTRRRSDKDEELARTSALKRFEYQPKSAEQRSTGKPPVQTVAGTEVFLEEKDKLAEERRKMIDSVVQKVMNKQLKDKKGFATEMTKRPASSGDRKNTESTLDASAGHSDPVRPPSLPNTFGMFNNGKRSKTVEAAKRPRISLAFDEEDFFEKSKTIVCDTTLGLSAPLTKKVKLAACQAATLSGEASESMKSETIGAAELLKSCRRLVAEQDKLVHAFENESALMPSSAEISAAIERELESATSWVAQTNLRRSQEQIMPHGWQSTNAWFSLPRRSPRSTLRQGSLLWPEPAARSPLAPPTSSHRFMSPSSSARPLLGSFGDLPRPQRGEDGGEPERLKFKTSPQLLL